MIAYGADSVTRADVRIVESLGLRAHQYLSVIARPEPENSLLEIVEGFSARPQDVLGSIDLAELPCDRS